LEEAEQTCLFDVFAPASREIRQAAASGGVKGFTAKRPLMPAEGDSQD
jgi:hypothetical protein